MTLSLHVEDLSITAPGGRVLLTAGRFFAAPGETVGLRGPSGAGKSTFLYALAGLQPHMSGRLSWGETDLVRLNDGARAGFRRQHVGLVFQDFLLFEELSALGNATLATAFAPPAARRSIRETAAEVLSRLKVPSGRRTVDSFSGGERQRTAIARALAHRPSIILADEPTASLDRDTADLLITDLIGLARTEKKTLIAVSHDRHLLDCMDRVIDIADGRLKTEVSPA
ncbi:ABC transporter ATP-binding protein [Roseibium marinum]|uniref:Putative ABC transport system ATP-binding protein n=1 Tax=Roseibium marinum TaxID=281252 RepID=A0A2S3UM12_9HYPH|nr:ATP-binding cassette domain-containing protein [Roseibium marinum]POF28519.1 putative ABC transport system ATP-binding protein [Roseibium marinum]